MRTKIDASGYIRASCQSIQSARLDHRHINLVLVEVPLRLRSEQCWKLGMIIAELITNSTRYAFDDGGGTIRIEMSASGPFAQCCITDNGSSHVPLQPGHGLKIVDVLARNLNGRIDHQFEPKEPHRYCSVSDRRRSFAIDARHLDRFWTIQL